MLHDEAAWLAQVGLRTKYCSPTHLEEFWKELLLRGVQLVRL
jgi:hypothetical protein